MDIRTIQDKVLEDLEEEMGARRAGVKRKPMLTIAISTDEPEEDEGMEMPEEMKDSAEDEMGIPEDGGWEEYLKKRYNKA